MYSHFVETQYTKQNINSGIYLQTICDDIIRWNQWVSLLCTIFGDTPDSKKNIACCCLNKSCQMLISPVMEVPKFLFW